MKNKLKPIVIKVAHFLEVALAIIILVGVALGALDTLRVMYTEYILHFSKPVNYDQINGMFAQILLLVIGVEIAVMLILHMQAALFEVLLYGIARKMLLIPKGNGMAEVILGVAAIGGLFLIKKYLSDPAHDEYDKSIGMEGMFYVPVCGNPHTGDFEQGNPIYKKYSEVKSDIRSKLVAEKKQEVEEAMEEIEKEELKQDPEHMIH